MLVLISLLVTVSFVVYRYVTRNYDYWKKQDVPHIPPIFLFGNMDDVLKGNQILPFILKGYEKFQDCLYFGYFKFMQPAIVLRDPKLVELIQVKEFSSFCDNDVEIDEQLDPYFGNNPFALKGDRWKAARSQMKAMFPLMVQVSETFVNYLINEPEARGKDGLLAKEVCAKFTTDSVARCGFNIDARSFVDPKAEIREIGRKILEPGFFSALRQNIAFFLPSLAKTLKIRLIPKEVSEYFRKLISDLVTYRKENNISENDFLDSMIKLKEKNKDINDTHMIANVLTFFTDGFETSSIILSLVLYYLGANPDIFRKLREEVDEIISNNNGKMTYDGIQEMKYLDCVISETLRITPAVGFALKSCTKDFTFPNPRGYDKGPGVVIKKGMNVIIPTWAIHHDPKYFPEPDIFDPERFSDERKSFIDKSTYMPFGLGPRTCLGQRFALTQMKSAVAAVVSKLDIKVNKKTPDRLELDFQSFLTAFKGGIWLNFYKRQQEE